MLKISKIKMKLVMIKSKFFFISKKQKVKDSRVIEELAFKSAFEKDIFDVLSKKWTNNSWIIEAAAVVLGLVYTIITEVFKLIF